MCQIKRDFYKNVRIIDRDQKLNQTYSRKRKARISLHHTLSSAVPKSPATTNSTTVSAEYSCYIHCDHMLSQDRHEQSDRCDKTMTTQNMELRNSILGNSHAQLNQKDTDQINGIRPENISRTHPDTEPHHSHNNARTSNKYRTGKYLAGISKFR